MCLTAFLMASTGDLSLAENKAIHVPPTAKLLTASLSWDMSPVDSIESTTATKVFSLKQCETIQTVISIPQSAGVGSFNLLNGHGWVTLHPQPYFCEVNNPGHFLSWR